MLVSRSRAVQALSMSTAETAVDDFLAAISGFREWEIADDAFTNVRKDRTASMLKGVSLERASELSRTHQTHLFHCFQHFLAECDPRV